MRQPWGLSAQITTWMIAVSALTLVILVLGWAAAYSIMSQVAPEFIQFDPNQSWWHLGLTDWLGIVGSGALGFLVATFASIFLARRIVLPVSAVANAAREVAQGNLAARARCSAAGFGETAQLISDFNQMAAQLATYESEMKTWNSAIAHELRTPLTILRGRLHGVYDGVFELDKEMISNLLQQVDGLTRIVEDLRTVSLAAAGRLDLLLGAVDLASEAQAVTAMVAPDLAAARITVETDLRSATSFADSARIRQALLALINNAVQYASDGRWIRVETEANATHGFIRVIDRGPGLPPDFGPRAFDAFSRAEESRSRAHGGTGLGLAVVQAIAHAHGGAARCMPGVEKGTIFEISIPRQAR